MTRPQIRASQIRRASVALAEDPPRAVFSPLKTGPTHAAPRRSLFQNDGDLLNAECVVLACTGIQGRDGTSRESFYRCDCLTANRLVRPASFRIRTDHADAHLGLANRSRDPAPILIARPDGQRHLRAEAGIPRAMTTSESEQPVAGYQARLVRWRWPLVTFFFALITCVWFAPLLVHLDTHVLVGPSDATHALRGYWAMFESGHTPWTYHHDPLNGAPEGYPAQAPVQVAQPIQSAFITLASQLVGLTSALNLFILLGFVGTSTAGYALGSRLGFGLLPSLVLGYIVGFNPWMFRRAFDGHITFVHGWVLVLVVIAALALIEHESIRSALLLGASLGLSFWMAAYFGLFASLPVALALVFVLVRARDLAGRLWACTLACATAGVTGAMLLPGALSYFAERDKVNQALDNPIGQLQTFGADLGSYLLPTEQNPAFGWVTRSLLSHGLDERLMYFGYSTMILAAVAVVLAFRGTTFSDTQRRAVIYASVLVPLAVLCSLPRVVHIGSLSIPAPAYVGGQITTFYRAYVRFGYIAGIGLALLAAAALAALLARRHHWVAGVAVALCVIELIPGRITTWDAANPPPVDKWLAAQPTGIVAHYPLYTDQQPALELAGFEFYAQRFHGQPLFTVFGAGYGLTREHAIRVLARYVTDPVTPGVLAAEHVRYIVLHDDVYLAQHEALPDLRPPEFVPLARFRNVRVFELHAAPADLEKTLSDNAASIALTQGLEPAEVSFGSGFKARTADGYDLLDETGSELHLRNDGAARFFELRLQLWAERGATVTVKDSNSSGLRQLNVPPSTDVLLTERFRLSAGQKTLMLLASDRGVVVRDAQAVPLADIESRLNH